MKHDPFERFLLGVVGALGALFALAIAGRVLVRLLSAGLIVIVLAVGAIALVSYLVALALRLRSAEAGIHQALGELRKAKETGAGPGGLAGLSAKLRAASPGSGHATGDKGPPAANDEAPPAPPARRILAGKPFADR